MKKLLTILFALVGINTWADNIWSDTKDGVYFTCEVIEDTNVKVIEINTENNVTTIKIPQAFEKNGITYRISTIGTGETLRFNGQTAKENITSLTIEDGISNIAGWAFNGWTGLTSLSLPSSLTNIGGCAFYDCSNLTSVNIPSSVTTLGEKIFAGCSSLTSITFNAIPNELGWGCVSNNTDNQTFNSNTTIYAPYHIMKTLKDTKLKEYAGNPTYKVFDVVLNENDNIDDLLVDCEISDNKIIINRTLHGGYWNTMCLPFYMSSDNITEAFGNDAKVMIFDGCTENIMKFKSINNLKKGIPFMVWVSSDKNKIELSYNGWINDDKSNINQNPDNKGYCMVGNLKGNQYVPNGAFFIANNQVYKSTGLSKMNAMSAYFTIPEDAPTEAKYSLSFNGETTSIKNITHIIPNGNNSVYNLQGNRISSPHKGIYIINGKKIIKR